MASGIQDHQSYRQGQLDRVQPDENMGVIPVKFGQSEGTNWLNITPEEFAEIKAILTRSRA